jgi:hypothetical protein
MSDQDNNEPVVSARLQQQREAAAKAREAFRQQREAQQRTGEEDRHGGIMADDAPRGERGERANFAREESLGPEVETRRDEREMTLTRRSRLERDVDGIYFPERLKKPGWDYQFVTVRVMNQDQGRVDESELVAWEDQGWRPCLARDYPALAGRDVPGDRPIEMRGSRAYERPKHLSLEAAEEDRQYAEEQLVSRTNATAMGAVQDGVPNDRRGLVRVAQGANIERGVWKK